MFFGAQGPIVVTLLIGERRKHEAIRHRRATRKTDGVERSDHNKSLADLYRSAPIRQAESAMSLSRPTGRLGADSVRHSA